MRPAELRWAYIRVGLFVAMSLLLAFGLLAAIGVAGSPFERRASLHGLFADVSGLAVGSPANCGACHPQAAQGQFDEHDVRIPR